MEGLLFVLDQLGRNLAQLQAEVEELRKQRDVLLAQLQAAPPPTTTSPTRSDPWPTA